MSTVSDDVGELISGLELTPAARELVERICKGQPVRNVGGGRGNVSVVFPSRKMGRGIQAESQYGELAMLLAWEWDAIVRGFFCQPHTLTLRYRSATGRMTGSRHTPDYLLIREDGVYFVEVTTQAEAERRYAKWPDRIAPDGNGGWRSPAGEAAAAPYDLQYLVCVPDAPDVVFIRNMRDLWEYFRSRPNKNQRKQIESLTNALHERKTILVRELREEYGPEVVKYAIAHRYAYCRLWEELLPTDPDICLYESPTYGHAARFIARDRPGDAPTVLRLDHGTSLTW